MTRSVAFTTPSVAPLDDLGREIKAVLREDMATGAALRYGTSSYGDLEFDGYCAVASAAYFFLAGEALAGFEPTAASVDWSEAGRRAREAGL